LTIEWTSDNHDELTILHPKGGEAMKGLALPGLCKAVYWYFALENNSKKILFSNIEVI
jgi:hypothetical protein